MDGGGGGAAAPAQLPQLVVPEYSEPASAAPPLATYDQPMDSAVASIHASAPAAGSL